MLLKPYCQKNWDLLVPGYGGGSNNEARVEQRRPPVYIPKLDNLNIYYPHQDMAEDLRLKPEWNRDTPQYAIFKKDPRRPSPCGE